MSKSNYHGYHPMKDRIRAGLNLGLFIMVFLTLLLLWVAGLIGLAKLVDAEKLIPLLAFPIGIVCTGGFGATGHILLNLIVDFGD